MLPVVACWEVAPATMTVGKPDSEFQDSQRLLECLRHAVQIDVNSRNTGLPALQGLRLRLCPVMGHHI